MIHMNLGGSTMWGDGSQVRRILLDSHLALFLVYQLEESYLTFSFHLKNGHNNVYFIRMLWRLWEIYIKILRKCTLIQYFSNPVLRDVRFSEHEYANVQSDSSREGCGRQQCTHLTMKPSSSGTPTSTGGNTWETGPSIFTHVSA